MIEQVLVGLIVLAALAFVGRRAWRTLMPARGKSGGCDSDCGCGH